VNITKNKMTSVLTANLFLQIQKALLWENMAKSVDPSAVKAHIGDEKVSNDFGILWWNFSIISRHCGRCV
jgi:hypothetical protein